MSEISKVATAIKAIEGWQRNRMTTFTPSNILSDFGEDILAALRLAAKDEAEPQTLGGMIAAIYGKLDAEDCAMIDREWAKQRGYILPVDGKSILATPPTAAKDEARERVIEEDDPSADERWQAGCDFALLQLCASLGVDPHMVTWDAATETLDGDVCAVIWNILRAKMGENWVPPEPLAWDANSNRYYEPVELLAQKLYERFDYDGPPGTKKPAWAPHGNGLKMDEARFLARKQLRQAGHNAALSPSNPTRMQGGEG